MNEEILHELMEKIPCQCILQTVAVLGMPVKSVVSNLLTMHIYNDTILYSIEMERMVAQLKEKTVLERKMFHSKCVCESPNANTFE